MPWTVLSCDPVEFSSVQNADSRVIANEPWEAAKVSLIAMSDHERWLMVTTERSPNPAVWRAIRESWIAACDEQSLTMLLQYSEGDNPSRTILKLRFSTPREFWTFAAHSTFARVDMQRSSWEGASQVGASQSTLDGALAGAAL